MLERETEAILKTITERTIGDQETLKLREALDAPIPRGVKAYLRAEVSRRIERDLESTASLSRIDRTTPVGAGLVRQLVRTLAHQYVLQREELLSLLDNAVHFLENYLCRPQWTLENFIFQESDTTSVAELLRSLEYFADYAYFPLLIERTLRQRGHDAVTADEFRSLVTNIDDQVVRQHTSHELSLLAKPIVDFLLLDNAATTAPIPIKPVLVFLDDKKLKVLKEYIESVAKIRNITELSLDDLATLIEDVHIGSVPPAAESPATPGAAAPSTIEPGAAEQMEPNEGTAAAPPLQPESPPVAEEPEQPPPAPAPADHLERGNKNISLSLTFAGMIERPEVPPPPPPEPAPESAPPPEPPSSLAALITDQMRESFVLKVFKNDVDYFDGVIGALNGFESWRQASVYLEELYDLNGLDPSQAEVQEFTETVARWFTLKGESGE